MKEIWKPVQGYEGLYEVSSLGRVRTTFLKSGTLKNKDGILTPFKQSNGYYAVVLHKNAKVKRFLVHRLVAIAFIANPKGKEIVNHIDENKENNVVQNLCWFTKRENNIYGTRVETIRAKMTDNEKITKAVIQLTKDGNFVAEYNSVRKAGVAMGKMSRSCQISACCCGHLKSAYGFVWRHK